MGFEMCFTLTRKRTEFTTILSCHIFVKLLFKSDDKVSNRNALCFSLSPSLFRIVPVQMYCLAVRITRHRWICGVLAVYLLK